MRDKNEDRGKTAGLDLVKSVRTPTNGNFNQTIKKSLKVKNKINPLLTQKYFACYSLAQTSQLEGKGTIYLMFWFIITLVGKEKSFRKTGSLFDFGLTACLYNFEN